MNKSGILILLLACITLFSGFLTGEFTEVKDIKTVLEPIKAVSLKTQSISATFTEEKHQAAFKKPSIAKGKFYYAEDDKMRWEQTEPFDYLILINGKNLIVRDNGVVKKMGEGSRTQYRISEFILALVKGNYQDNTKFAIRCFESTDLYQVQLTPKSSMLGKVYKNLKLHFSKKDKRLQFIEFYESNGDKKILRFSNQVYNSQLSNSLFAL